MINVQTSCAAAGTGDRHAAGPVRGLARRLVAFIMEELARRGYRSIHLIVNSRNETALRSYAAFSFDTVGECDMYNQHFLCFEKGLGEQ